MPALSGGRIYIGGRSWGIDFSSGHYRPDIYAIAMMYEYIGRIVAIPPRPDTTAMHWIGSVDGWTWTEKDFIESDSKMMCILKGMMLHRLRSLVMKW